MKPIWTKTRDIRLFSYRSWTMRNVVLDELRFTDTDDKKDWKGKEKFAAVGTPQRVSFKLLLFSTWPHDTTMLLNSPSWTADNAVMPANFRGKKNPTNVSVEIRPAIVRFHWKLANRAGASPSTRRFCNIIGQQPTGECHRDIKAEESIAIEIVRCICKNVYLYMKISGLLYIAGLNYYYDRNDNYNLRKFII